MKTAWHALSVDDVVRRVETDRTLGLGQKSAARRLSRFGPNRLNEAKSAGPFSLFMKQFQDVMVMVLIGAAAISAALGETLDAVAIVAIVVINACLGFAQEYKAERSLRLLKGLTAPQTVVKRDGEPMRIPADEVVVGDLLLLKEGDRAPADARIASQVALQVDESPLTGESVPVKKVADWTGAENTELAERKNMLFMGTTVVRGRAEAIVVATGMDTQIGDIAQLMQEVEAEPTPLQRRLSQLGGWLVGFCLLVVAVVFVSGVLQGLPMYTMFLTAVSLAVAAIPEGLPAVVTVALALGVQRMIKRKAIVRKLPAVESLGCATIICSDKTGTLTRNEMTVTNLTLPSGRVDVSGAGYAPKGALTKGRRPASHDDPDLLQALIICELCNNASLIPKSRGRAGRSLDSDWRVIGDPTEAALAVVARKGGIDPKRLRQEWRLIGEIPFDSDRKRMSVVAERGAAVYALVKGAPDVILQRCAAIQENGQRRSLSDREREQYKSEAAALAGDALRVLALAFRRVDPNAVAAKKRGASSEWSESDVEEGLTFCGLVGMIDPLREEVASAVQVARRAGVETVMVTGDHPRTALAIARKLGIAASGALTGKEIDHCSDSELEEACARYQVFARVSPRHKLRIVRALKRRGHVVAMTGDGVNDAPAVKEADIGVAMGISGTDVTREASDMTLADDNYATLVAAIQEGRGIYDNIRKFIRYLLACNTGEVLAMFIAVALGMPLPLLPIQILWVNLVTDGLPAIALGVDPPDPDVMRRPPRRPNEGVFARRLHVKIAVRGLFIGLGAVVAFAVGQATAPRGVDSLAFGRTMAFSTLVCSQLIYVFQCRSERRSLAEVGLWGNKWLVAAVIGSFAMQAIAVHFGPAARLFETTPLRLVDWMAVLALSGWTQALEMALATLRRQFLKRISALRV